MSFVRRALPFCLLALVFAVPAHAAKPKPQPAAPKSPQGLHAFMLRADEPVADTFPRTPSFAWQPVSGASKYDFELSTSSRFIESALVWEGTITGTPAVSVPDSLPWMTGNPYALYARVRTVTATSKSSWSPPFGFNMRPPDAPLQIMSYPGLVRWATVEGATSYQVWWTDLGKQVSTLANSADEREYYTFHQAAPWPSLVHWRVRAVRSVYGTLPSGLPVVAYGPWSPTFTSYNPPFPVGPVGLSSTISATVDAGSDLTNAHTHTPAFLFGGTQTLSALESELYRVYVFTDKDCVNQIFRGAVTGSPAYSPRTSGPLALPADANALQKARQTFLKDGSEGTTQMADLAPVLTSEAKDTSASTSTSAEPPPATEPAPTPTPSSFTLPAAQGALVDIWDSGWPTGLYYWTVIPVNVVPTGDTGGFVYRDAELPQDACAAGRIGSFGKESDPVLISEHATALYAAEAPYASGLSTDGRLVSASKTKPVFYGTPLVAWRPALGAAAYEIQWSKSSYPWKTEGQPVFTFGTSTLLTGSDGKPLAPGSWYYRVRGLDPYLPGSVKVMSWSPAVQVVVAKPKFSILGGGKEEKSKKQSFRTWIQSGFAVSAPSNWKVKSDTHARFYLAKGLKNLATGSTSLRFMASDPDDANRATGVSVSFVPTREDHTHAAWVKAVKETLAKAGLLNSPKCVAVKLPAGPALKCSYAFAIPKTTRVESEVSYWFDRVGKTYVLALDNLRSADKAKASLRLSIARGFKITS